MLWFKKKKKKEEKKDEEIEEELPVNTPQQQVDGFLKGMYCEACGYMEVNEDSNELPLEGFAMCPNCGAPLKLGWFKKDANGFHLVENAGNIIAVEERSEVKRTLNSGGHHRVRPAGPARLRKKVSHHR